LLQKIEEKNFILRNHIIQWEIARESLKMLAFHAEKENKRIIKKERKLGLECAIRQCPILSSEVSIYNIIFFMEFK